LPVATLSSKEALITKTGRTLVARVTDERRDDEKGMYYIDRKSGYTAHLTSSIDTPPGTTVTVTSIVQKTFLQEKWALTWR